jgi:hypothetical protein
VAQASAKWCISHGNRDVTNFKWSNDRHAERTRRQWFTVLMHPTFEKCGPSCQAHLLMLLLGGSEIAIVSRLIALARSAFEDERERSTVAP